MRRMGQGQAHMGLGHDRLTELVNFPPPKNTKEKKGILPLLLINNNIIIIKRNPL